MAIFEWRQRRRPLDGGGTRRRILFRPWYSRNFKRMILFAVVFLAVFPPLFFHFKLRRFRQIVARKCDWLHHPPLVCAHGGDSTLAFPNTVHTLDPFPYSSHSSKTLLSRRWMLTVTLFVLELIASKSMFLVPPMVFYSLSTTGYRLFSFSFFVSFFCDLILIEVVLHRLITRTVRDLQRIARNSSVQVGDLSMKQVSSLFTIFLGDAFNPRFLNLLMIFLCRSRNSMSHKLLKGLWEIVGFLPLKML